MTSAIYPATILTPKKLKIIDTSRSNCRLRAGVLFDTNRHRTNSRCRKPSWQQASGIALTFHSNARSRKHCWCCAEAYTLVTDLERRVLLNRNCLRGSQADPLQPMMPTLNPSLHLGSKSRIAGFSREPTCPFARIGL